MTSAIAKLEASIASQDVTAIVTYRGLWCPFCQDYLKRIAALNADIEAAGGKVFALTAETPEQAATAAKEWELPYEVIGDPSNEAVKHLNATYGLDAFITSEGDKRLEKYPAGKGFVQPSLLFVGRRGTVLYKWAIVPAVMNYLGAKDRPVPAEVWAAVKAALKISPSESGAVSVTPGLITGLDGITLPPAEEYAAAVTLPTAA